MKEFIANLGFNKVDLCSSFYSVFVVDIIVSKWLALTSLEQLGTRTLNENAIFFIIIINLSVRGSHEMRSHREELQYTTRKFMASLYSEFYFCRY